MRIIIFCLLSFVLINNTLANDLRKKAEENPLDCAFYLLTKEENLSPYDSNKLVRAYLELKRIKDISRTIELFDNDEAKFNELIGYVHLLIIENRKAEASILADKAILLLKNRNDSWIIDLIAVFIADLVELNRSVEAIKIIEDTEDKLDKTKLSIKLAEAFLNTNQTEKALKSLPAWTEAECDEQKLKIIELYAKLKQFEKLEKTLAEFEQTAFVGMEEGIARSNKRFTLLPIINASLALGKIDHALALWRQHGDEDYSIWLIESLLEFGYREKAAPYFLEIEANPELLGRNGKDLVKIYLQLGEIDTAISTAKKMSDDVDSYWQQNSFIRIADRFVKDGEVEKAIAILNFGFQRARKVKFEDYAGSSIGASPASRKTIYLRNIANRFLDLKHFDKALTVINAVEDENLRISLHTEFARRQIKTLPKNKIFEILSANQKAVEKMGIDYQEQKNLIAIAVAYGEAGAINKANEIFAAVLLEASESNLYLNDFLAAIGLEMEKHNWQADAKLKSALKKIVADN
jgi:hypothetical protein